MSGALEERGPAAKGGAVETWPSMSRGLGLLGLLALVMVLANVGLVASTFSDELPPSFACKAIEVVAYLVATLAILRARPGDPLTGKRALILILATGAILRVMFLFAPPDSTDVNRYIWDGRVQAAGINPYRFIPADPALKFLRDDDIYPEINRANYAPTIYPPLAQMVFFAVTRLSESVFAMKTAMVICEGLAVWVLTHLLRSRGLPLQRTLLYAWHPLPLWEFAGSGHIDAAAILCVMLAVLAFERQRPFLAGLALGGATLIKFLPVIIGPALYRRWDWRLPLAGFVTLLVLYLPYASAGSTVFGFLGGYSGEEGLRDGSGLYLWLLVRHLLPVSPQDFRFFYPVAALALGALALGVLVARKGWRADIPGTLLLAELLAAITSPHYPWYFAWLVPFLCLVPTLAGLYVTCAGTLIYIVDWPPSFIGGTILFGPFLVCLVVDTVRYFGGGPGPRRSDPLIAPPFAFADLPPSRKED